MRLFISLLPVLFVAIFLYFYGVTTVTAKDQDGNPVEAKVYINGEYVGKTPYEARLWVGTFSIKVKPPKGYRGAHSSWESWSMGRGQDIVEEMEVLKYRVVLSSPWSHGNVPDYAIWDERTDKVIATSSGVDCEITLPGPGRYHAYMQTGNCDTGRCTKGDYPFEITDDHEVATVNWR